MVTSIRVLQSDDYKAMKDMVLVVCLGEHFNNWIQRNERDGSCSLGGYYTTTWVEDNDKEDSDSYSGVSQNHEIQIKEKRW